LTHSTWYGCRHRYIVQYTSGQTRIVLDIDTELSWSWSYIVSYVRYSIYIWMEMVTAAVSFFSFRKIIRNIGIERFQCLKLSSNHLSWVVGVKQLAGIHELTGMIWKKFGTIPFTMNYELLQKNILFSGTPLYFTTWHKHY